MRPSYASRLTILALAFTPLLSTARAQTAPAGAARPPIIAAAVRASLRGIQLTGEQQTAVKAVVVNHQPQIATVRDSMKPWVAKLQAARQQHDTTAARAARVALRRGRLGIASITRQALLQVRPLLTVAQQPQFDANIVRVRPALARFVRTGRRPG